MQAHHLQVFVTKVEHLPLAGDIVDLTGLTLQGFDNADQRQDVTLIPHRDQLPIHDRQRQR